MTKLLRMAAVAALTLSTTPAFAAPTPPDKQATATVTIVKPLKLEWAQDLDLGSITLTGSGSTTVGITKAGVFSCPAGNATCTGTPKVAKYKVTGIPGQSVTVNSGNVTLTSGANQLLMTVDAPASVLLTNALGDEFSIGGNVTVNGATVDGTYQGTFAVTVNY
ncbi:DUF4402 domain-containing protein [Sphingomonas sp. SM33]|uniref:DUF4402 domain-containing protein n=1 Tax=Sphingomonas telluris TaxID=2907998 RepID=A0ABS9VPE2_9SPHN|nr:DUF4402 domain-containing protein [Sphingomonas telluris]MCH8616843.1 DUF4402 domain-containing protein [Sphingomonas telluris]